MSLSQPVEQKGSAGLGGRESSLVWMCSWWSIKFELDDKRPGPEPGSG